LAARGPGTDANPFLRRQRRGVDERPTRLGIEPIGALLAVGPGDLAERLAVDELAVLAVEAIEVAVAVGLHQRLDRLAVPFDIDQNRLVDAVIIPDVVRAVLEVPLVGAV